LRTLLDSGVPRFQNVDTHAGGRIISKDLSQFRARRDALDWSDLRWLRELWPGKLMVKGILTAQDAVLAAENGADGVFVSNHGGRQLDGAISPMTALPEIVDAVGGRMAIMLDSGIRRGTDIVKALALGADMVFVGRAALYGATVAKQAGVEHALALLGCRSVGDLGPQHLQINIETVDEEAI